MFIAAICSFPSSSDIMYKLSPRSQLTFLRCRTRGMRKLIVLNKKTNGKLFVYLFMVAAIAFVYIGYSIFQLSRAHPVILIYVSTHSDWYTSGNNIPPFPMRSAIAEKKFMSFSLKDLENTPAFNLNLFTVFATIEQGNSVSTSAAEKHEKYAEHLIRLGVDIDHTTDDGCDALKTAIVNQNTLAVKYLIGKKPISILDQEEDISESTNPCDKSVDSLFHILSLIHI